MAGLEENPRLAVSLPLDTVPYSPSLVAKHLVSMPATLSLSRYRDMVGFASGVERLGGGVVWGVRHRGRSRGHGGVVWWGCLLKTVRMPCD